MTIEDWLAMLQAIEVIEKLIEKTGWPMPPEVEFIKKKIQGVLNNE